MCEGTFGQVLERLDNEKKEPVGIKIVRSINKYREAAMIEIDVLQKLARHDVVMHDLRLIHTDLKPENILLVSSEYIKVPDYKALDGIIHVICGVLVAYLLNFALLQMLTNKAFVSQVLPALYCRQEFVNGAVPIFSYSSIYYKRIPHNGSLPWRPDDKEGHYMFAVGENITPRCTFGQVLECLDNEKKEPVAIKIVRAIKKYREAAMIEIDVL
ncbi:hypothetical protein R6Q57_018470 [Mikania cordata]